MCADRRSPFWIVAVLCWSTFGCAAASTNSNRVTVNPTLQDPLAEVRFEYGAPNRFLDNMRWVVSLPGRIFTWHWEEDDLQLSAGTEEQIVAYLRETDLSDVYVRVNQYCPAGEWRRLRENTAISPGWKYSAGLLSILHYSVIPGRVFGGDEYNPYTNSLSVNSDELAMVLHEAAYAKQIHETSRPGPYAFLNDLPVLSLWRHTAGVREVVSYAREHDDWELERQTYRVVYPQMGANVAGLGDPFVPLLISPLLPLGGAAAGHVIGQTTIAMRKRQQGDVPIAENARDEILQTAADEPVTEDAWFPNEAILSGYSPPPVAEAAEVPANYSRPVAR